jgi:lipopolysaccharide export system permease protein
MVVLFACGMSQRQLLVVTLIPAFVIALLVALFSFWLSPVGAQLNAKILDEQRNRSEFDSLNAGRFQTLGQGQTIVYVDELTNNRKRLGNVFIARDGADKFNRMIAVAKSGEQAQLAEYGQRYLMLHEGHRYEGRPGTPEFRITKFSTYGQYMPPFAVSADYTNETDAKSTRELFLSDDRALKTALQWRISLPILVFIATLLAVPLSKTNPRQGRYLKMLPAVLVFVFYFTFLSSVRGAMESGKWPMLPGLWAVHFAFLFLAVLLFKWDQIKFWFSGNSAGKTANA